MNDAVVRFKPYNMKLQARAFTGARRESAATENVKSSLHLGLEKDDDLNESLDLIRDRVEVKMLKQTLRDG